jgi:endonuclease/exonuclease/phosphatase family metal-dependent hydrolase
VPQDQKVTFSALSFNVLYKNPKPEQLLAFLREQVKAVDVICLQEVRQEILTELEKFGVFIKLGADAERQSKSTGKKIYDHIVIMSRHPMGKARWRRYEVRDSPTRRWRLFDKLTSGKEETSFLYEAKRGSVSADVIVDGRPVRVICGHPSVWGAKRRRGEILDLLDQVTMISPTIVCGDFNILDDWVIKAVTNFLCADTLGEGLYEMGPWYRERTMMERLFQLYLFQNPLKGHKTFWAKLFGLKFGFQLDHALVPASSHVTRAEVLPDMYGSDHHPVLVEVEL